MNLFPPSLYERLFLLSAAWDDSCIFKWHRVDVCGQPSQHLMMNLQVTARKNRVKDGFPFLHHTAQDSVNPDGLTVSIQGDAFHCQQLIPKQILFKC